MKKSGTLLRLLGMTIALSGGNSPNIVGLSPQAFKKPKRKDEHNVVSTEPETDNLNDRVLLSRGLTKFWYENDNFVWALNQRTADSKAKKKSYL